MTTNESIKLFWPSHLCSPKSKAGYIIGWYNTLSTICVAAIMPGMEVRKIESKKETKGPYAHTFYCSS
jgi:phosphatidylinositol glycan class Q protein